MERKMTTVILLLSVLVFILSACSYKEFEDSMKDKLNKPEEEEYINPAKIPEKSTNTENEDTSESEEKRLYTVGETITFAYPTTGYVQYTLNEAHIVDNINDLGIKKDDFLDSLYIADNGDISNDKRLLTVDVTIKNIDYQGHYEDEEEYTINIESSVGFKDAIEDPDGPFLFEPVYFSEHPENYKDDYLYFPLNIGEEIDATVGWIIPEENLNEEPLYYVIGAGGFFDLLEYFELTFD